MAENEDIETGGQNLNPDPNLNTMTGNESLEPDLASTLSEPTPQKPEPWEANTDPGKDANKDFSGVNPDDFEEANDYREPPQSEPQTHQNEDINRLTSEESAEAAIGIVDLVFGILLKPIVKYKWKKRVGAEVWENGRKLFQQYGNNPNPTTKTVSGKNVEVEEIGLSDADRTAMDAFIRAYEEMKSMELTDEEADRIQKPLAKYYQRTGKRLPPNLLLWAEGSKIVLPRVMGVFLD